MIKMDKSEVDGIMNLGDLEEYRGRTIEAELIAERLSVHGPLDRINDDYFVLGLMVKSPHQARPIEPDMGRERYHKISPGDKIRLYNQRERFLITN